MSAESFCGLKFYRASDHEKNEWLRKAEDVVGRAKFDRVYSVQFMDRFCLECETPSDFLVVCAVRDLGRKKHCRIVRRWCLCCGYYHLPLQLPYVP